LCPHRLGAAHGDTALESAGLGEQQIHETAGGWSRFVVGQTRLLVDLDDRAARGVDAVDDEVDAGYR